MMYMHIAVPGMPLDVKLSELMTTSVRLTWTTPLQKGTPALSFYVVRLEPSHSPSTMMFWTMSSDPELQVSGLAPGTIFTAIVTAVITDHNFPPQEGVASFPVVFTTLEEGLRAGLYYYCVIYYIHYFCPLQPDFQS